MRIRVRHQKVPIRVKNGKLNLFSKKVLWYGSKKGLEYWHMILMNIFMEENPRVTYIEKKLERVTLNFQRVTTRDSHVTPFFSEMGCDEYFFSSTINLLV